MKARYQSTQLLLIACFTVVCSTSLLAQELPEEKQEIIKTFEAQLEEARIINMAPVIKPVVPIKKKYSYNVTILPLDIEYPEPVIKPIAADTDLPFEPYPFYTRIGYGNVKNPGLELGFYKTDEYQFDRYIHLAHQSFDNSSKVADQKAGTSSALAGIRYKIKEKWQLNAGVNATYRQQPFYFIYEGNDLNDKDRNLFNAGFKAEVFHGSIEENDVEFRFNTSYSVLNVSNPDKNEGQFKVETSVAKKKGNWRVDLPLQFTGVLQTEISDLYSLVFDPRIKYSNPKWFLTAGAAIYFDATEKTIPWPEIQFDYALAGKGMHVFALSQLRVSGNNLHRLTLDNPWLNPTIPSLSNFIGKEIMGGIRGETEVVGYEAAAGYVNGRNWDQFNNEQKVYSANVFYTDLNAVFIRSNIDFAVTENVRLKGLLTKNFFDKKGLDKLYGMHSLEFKAQAEFRLIHDRIKFTPELFVTDRQWARVVDAATASPTDIRLNNRIELNAGLDIWISKKFGIYAKANNLLNNKYEQWYGYPSLGIHVQGGLLIKL